MQIKDESGNVIANIDIQDGFSVQDLVKSISNKKFKSLRNLNSIVESSDKKQIIFNFDDGSIYYDLPTKAFLRQSGIKIGEGSFKNIILNIKNKTEKKEYKDVDDFWLKLAEKTDVIWIKTFFRIVDVWANSKHGGGGWINTRERNFRNKLQRLNDDKKFFDCIESFSKIPQIQSIEDDGDLDNFYENILVISKKVVSETKEKVKFATGIYINFGKIKVDNWFFENSSKRISENFCENKILINYIGDYVKCIDHGIKDLFKYTFETHGGVIVFKQIENIKKLIKFGYEPKRLIDYLYRDIYNQGLDLSFERTWGVTSEGLDLLHDYANMNVEMKRQYEKYPRYLRTYHDITQKNYEIEEDNIISQKFSERIKELKKEKFEYSDENYVIVLPKSGMDLAVEGQNLNHCVASYYKRMANGETNIVFLRKKNESNTSLVTIEIKERKIVQAKTKNNNNPGDAEAIFIGKYQNYLENS